VNIDDKPQIPIGAKLTIISLLCVFTLQSYIAAHHDSVTIDEFVHLPVGLYSLYTGDFMVDPINPPLSRMIPALPLLWHPPVFSPESGTPHWLMGDQLMYNNYQNYQDLFVRGRFIITLLAVILGLIVITWTIELYGWVAGIVATILFTFSPTMLTHAHLVTADMAGALGFTASMWTTWRFLDKPSYTRAILLGIILAISMLLKLSALVLIVVVVLLMLIRAIYEHPQRIPWPIWLRHWVGLLITTGLVALLVLNAGYGFGGTFAHLSETQLMPNGQLFSLAESYPWLRLPLPQSFISGVDMVLNVGKIQEPTYFLAGELSADGWWYYHVAAFGLKSPLPLILAGIAALILWVTGHTHGLRDHCLFIPIIAIFAANSLFNSLYIGVRHILPIYPLLFISTSALFAKPLVILSSHNLHMTIPALRKCRSELGAAMGSLLLIGWFIGGSLAVAPRYMEYFNEIAGGREGGYRYLIDSNLDWGQDLIRLRKYMHEHSIKNIQLAYFGRVDPAVYGISYTPLKKEKIHGPVAISASFLMGRPYFWLQNRQMSWINSGHYTWLQEYEPVARVGSMFIFNLP